MSNVEMGVQLLGSVDSDRGEAITAVGVLGVVYSPAVVVNGMNMPASTSVVVVGVRVR